MIQLSNEYKRNLLFTNTNKALLEIVKNATPEQLTQLKESKDLRSILTSLFQEKLTGNKSDQLLLEMLKTAPQFKTLGNFNDNLKSLLKELKTLGDLPTTALEKFIQTATAQINSKNLQTQMSNSGVFMESKIGGFIQQTSQQPQSLPTLQELKTDLGTLYAKLLSDPSPQTEKLLDTLETFLSNPSKTTIQEIKTLLSTLKEAPTLPKEVLNEPTKIIPKLTALLRLSEPTPEHPLPAMMADDLKSSLMSLSKELQYSLAPDTAAQLEQIDKLLLQIDYHQLQSHLSGSASLFFPFEWNQLQEGSFQFKKNDSNKSYCNVHLEFKEYGELTIMMSLYDEYQLDIHFHAEKKSLALLLQEHLDQLKGALRASGLLLKSIRIHEENENNKQLHEAYSENDPRSYGGFEVKG